MSIDARIYGFINGNDAVSKYHKPAIYILAEIGLEKNNSKYLLKSIFLNFCDGIGWSGEEGDCYFSLSDTSSDNNVYARGIYFDDGDENCILSFLELYNYMVLMAERYCQYFPEEKKSFEEILNKFRQTYNIT